MHISMTVRTQILGLHNTTEAARLLNVPVGTMHRHVRNGLLPKPEIKIGKTMYYDHDDVAVLRELVAKMKSHP